MAFDVGAEVNLHDVILIENSVVPGVGSVVSGDIVEGATCGEGDT